MTDTEEEEPRKEPSGRDVSRKRPSLAALGMGKTQQPVDAHACTGACLPVKWANPPAQIKMAPRSRWIYDGAPQTSSWSRMHLRQTRRIQVRRLLNLNCSRDETHYTFTDPYLGKSELKSNKTKRFCPAAGERISSIPACNRARAPSPRGSRARLRATALAHPCTRTTIMAITLRLILGPCISLLFCKRKLIPGRQVHLRCGTRDDGRRAPESGDLIARPASDAPARDTQQTESTTLR